MKRLLPILLCILMVLSMVACGGNQGNRDNLDNGENQNNQGNIENEQPQGEPTPEEQTAISNYVAAYNALTKFAETGDWSNLGFNCQQFGVPYEDNNDYLWGTEAAKAYYDYISGLDVIDKWVGTDYAQGGDINWDRQSVLDSFVVYKDVKLSENYTLYDGVGNTKNLAMTWNYTADGNLQSIKWDDELGERYPYAFVLDPIEVDPLHLLMQDDNSRAEPTFDANGNMTQVKILTYSETQYLGTITYGSNGKPASAIITDTYGNTGELTYSYDSSDRLTEVSYYSNHIAGNLYYYNGNWEGFNPKLIYGSCDFTYTYTYNADGTVAVREYIGYDIYKAKTHSVVTQFTYDTNGFLSGAVCDKEYNMIVHSSAETHVVATDTYTFTCDANGTPIAATISCGNLMHTLFDNYVYDYAQAVKIEVEAVSGDLYVYSPVN